MLVTRLVEVFDVLEINTSLTNITRQSSTSIFKFFPEKQAPDRSKQI